MTSTQEALEKIVAKFPGVKPFDFQLKLAATVCDSLSSGKKSFLITDQAGYGKTFTTCMAIAKRKEDGVYADKPYLWPVVVFTPANVITQWKRVIKLFQLEDTIALVTNYDQLRASFGDNFLSYKIEVVHGQEITRVHWSPIICGAIKDIILDECQNVKNEGALKTKIIQELVDYIHTQHAKERGADGIQFILLSATPYTRLCEAKVWVTSSRVPVRFGYATEPCSSRTWPTLVGDLVAHGTQATDHSPQSCENLREYMKGYWGNTSYKDVQKSFALLGMKLYRASNGTLLIRFRTPEQAKHYAVAYEEYLKRLAKIDKDAPGGIAELWVAILMFRIAAEECRAADIAEAMYQSVATGHAAIGAFNFKKSIGLAVKYLVDVRGIPRDKISVVWGGMDNLEEDCDYLGLGVQSRKQRQKEIDRFQKGEALYCFFTFKSGGVGLSLHHDREGGRPRETFIAPTYSAIELVQGTGRAHRITSLSNTTQTVIYYADTIEEQVAAKVAIKMKCLREAVNARETWADEYIPKQHGELKAAIGVGMLQLPVKETEDEEALDGVYIEEETDGETPIDV